MSFPISDSAIITKVKRKYIITAIEVTKLERFKPIEVRVPSNVRKITGVLVTASLKEATVLGMERLGLVTFQSNDAADVFHVAEVRENDVELSDETLLNIEDPQFESDAAWITGRLPEIHPVTVEGDSILIKAWLKGEKFDSPYTLRVYVEYEEAEELIEVELEKEQDDKSNPELEPQEINL